MSYSISYYRDAARWSETKPCHGNMIVHATLLLAEDAARAELLTIQGICGDTPGYAIFDQEGHCALMWSGTA